MKKEQTDYKVVGGEIVEEFVSNVKDLMKEGWRVTGGVERIGGFYTQTMVFETTKSVSDYIIVSENDQHMFVKEVNAMIQNGWELWGGASTSQQIQQQYGGVVRYVTHFVQALVKFKD